MQLDFDETANALRLTAAGEEPDPARRQVELAGILDIGEGGRLVGLEIRGVSREHLSGWFRDSALRDAISIDDDGSIYLSIAGGEDRYLRSVDVLVGAEVLGDALVALSIPRRGAGYEISYPSGNQ